MRTLLKRIPLAAAVAGVYLAVTISYTSSPPGAVYLLTASLTAAIGLFVLTRDWPSPVNRAFLCLCLSLAAYLMVIYVSHMAASAWGIRWTEPAIRVLRMGFLPLPVFLMYFTHQFVDRQSRFLRALARLSLVSVLPFLALNLAGRYVSEYRLAEHTFVPAGPRWPYLAYTVLCGLWFLIWFCVILVQCCRRSQARRRSQHLLLLAGPAVAMVNGLLSSLPAFGVFWYPSFTAASYLAFPLAIGIAVLWFRMFDIRIVLRRTLPYAAVTAVIGALYALSLTGLRALGEYVGSLPGGAGTVILLVFVGFGFQPALEALQRGLDRLFFRAEAQLDRFLADAGVRYRNAASDIGLSRMVATDARASLYFEDCTVLLGEDRVRCAAASLSGLDEHAAAGLPMPRRAREGTIFEAEDARPLQLPAGAGVLSNLLDDAGVRVVVPFGSGEASGLLACKGKLSGLPLSGRDKVFLQALAAQAGTALARISASAEADQLKERTDAIFDAMTNAVALVDASGVVLDSNPAFESAFGGRRGCSVNELGISPALSAAEGPKEVATPHGIFLVSAIALNDHQGANTVVLVLTDVTELRRLQEVESRKEVLAEIGAAMSAVNHEIMNILSPLGFFLRRAEQAQDIHEARQPLEHARRALSGLERLTREMRDLYRAPALSLRSVKLEGVVESCLADLASEAGGAWIPPETAGLDVALQADPQKLKQAMLNVLKNAWDAMRECQDKRWAVHASREPGLARINIRDSGTGIAPESLERVFKAFYTTKGARGTGLGLSIVQRIADAHGAEVTVESELGQGTVVTLVWPSAN